MACDSRVIRRWSIGYGDRYVNSTNEHIVAALRVARQLTLLADEGEASVTDDGSRALFCEIRDCAYRIRARAEHERAARRTRGLWEYDESS